jgi:hypothetical protein
MVKQSWVSTKDRSDSALRHRQEILDVLGRAERDRFAELERSAYIGKDDGGRTVRDQRAIRALERSRHARIFFAFGAAELVAQVLADLGIRIGHTIAMVLGGDARQCIGLITPALEITRCDLAEDPGKAAVDIRLLADVRRLEQVAPDVRRGRCRHLLDADHKRDARGSGSDRIDRLMYRGRAGGTGVLDPARALEAQVGRSLEHQRGSEILRREPGVEMPEQDLVDIGSGNPGIGERLLGDAHDQALDRLALEPAEGRMSPANDASRHGALLSFGSVWRFPGRGNARPGRNATLGRTRR